MTPSSVSLAVLWIACYFSSICYFHLFQLDFSKLEDLILGTMYSINVIPFEGTVVFLPPHHPPVPFGEKGEENFLGLGVKYIYPRFKK